MGERNANGRFTIGNPGGPGRPRRAIEREYLAALGDAVSLHDWLEIVERAVVDAKAGDHQARCWLSKHLLGTSPGSLEALAADELGGRTPDHIVSVQAQKIHGTVRSERFAMRPAEWSGEDRGSSRDDNELQHRHPVVAGTNSSSRR